jgi:hypothetical protein
VRIADAVARGSVPGARGHHPEGTP